MDKPGDTPPVSAEKHKSGEELGKTEAAKEKEREAMEGVEAEQRYLPQEAIFVTHSAEQHGETAEGDVKA